MSDEIHFGLTSTQREFVLANYDKLSLMDLTKKTFNDDSLDGRCGQAKAIKAFLADAKNGPVNIKTTKFISVKEAITLNEDQKKFIEDNCVKMKPLELARLLFQNQGLAFSSFECRAVSAYTKVINPESIDMSDEPVDDKEYKPPNQMQHAFSKIKEYVTTADPNKNVFDFKNLKPQEVKCINGLLGYMRTIRFCYQANQYQKRIDRTLFESTFVRFAFDKPELAAEEVDQYISAAAETVSIATMERQVQSFEAIIQERLLGDDNNQKLGMTMVELVNTSRAKLDASKERLKKLLDSLVGSRAKRMENKIQANASVLNLLMAWQNEKRRIELIALGDKEQREDGEEMERLESMEDVKCLIAGLTREEARHGL